MTEADKVTVIREDIPDSLAKALMERQQFIFKANKIIYGKEIIISRTH